MFPFYFFSFFYKYFSLFECASVGPSSSPFHGPNIRGSLWFTPAFDVCCCSHVIMMSFDVGLYFLYFLNTIIIIK